MKVIIMRGIPDSKHFPYYIEIFPPECPAEPNAPMEGTNETQN